MREAHPVFERPSAETPLWRYLPFRKFECLLRDRALYFCRTDLLGDPLEGSFTKARQAERARLLQNPPDEMSSEQLQSIFAHSDRLAADSRLMQFVSCWHSRDDESSGMWQAYGGGSGGEGVAVRTTFGTLDQAVPEKFTGSYHPMPIWIGRVRYIDHGSVTDRIPHEFNLYGPVLAKSLDFQHEDEVRAIYWDIPTLDMARGLAERPIGFNVPVDIGALVQSVVISPFASPRFVAKVRKTCALFGWGDLPIESSGAVS